MWKVIWVWTQSGWTWKTKLICEVSTHRRKTKHDRVGLNFAKISKINLPNSNDLNFIIIHKVYDTSECVWYKKQRPPFLWHNVLSGHVRRSEERQSIQGRNQSSFDKLKRPNQDECLRSDNFSPGIKEGPSNKLYTSFSISVDKCPN